MLLERCLEKNGAQRYHTIADARVDLQKAMADPAGFSAPAAPPGRTLSIPWYWAAALVALVAAIVGATIWGMSPARDLSIVRFSDVLPQNNFFTNAGHSLIAISPDATSVAYVAANRLFLRPQDRVEASPISGTEGSPTTPFFSPDGQFLGYFDFAQGELRRIPVAGGTPVTLAKVTNVFGARWNIDDTIVYGADTGVWKISARGGAPEAVVRITGGERMQSPQLLPGAYRSAAGNMMAVPLQADTAIPAGRAQELFRAQGRFRFSGNTAAYDVEPNGQRFIMVTEPENAVPARQQIVVVRNWFEELNRLVPATR